jgi:hypothetical protein
MAYSRASDRSYVIPRSEKTEPKPLYVYPGCSNHMLLAVLKPNRIIRKRTDANCISFHLRVFVGLSNPRDRGRLALYLYCVITLVKEKLSVT